MATATASRPKTNVKFRPLDDRVLVEPLDAEEMTSGGIVLPDSAREKQTRGRVLATGPGKSMDSGERCALSVKVGDQVVYGKYSGTEVKLDQDDYVVLRESDILAVVE